MTGERVRKILGVHGIGNYRYHREGGAGALASEWTANLEQALPPDTRVDLDVAFYAHHLHRGTPQGATDDPTTLEPEAQEFLVDWVELLRPEGAIPQGPRTVRARQAVDWITRRFGPAARTFAMAFCREVHTYLARPDSPRRVAARQAVADAIDRHRPEVIVAHSLGSVVAYEALWAHPGRDVDLLVTLGSPLAMPGVVLPRLVPGDETRGRPPRVRRWLNFADIGDLVAVPRTGLCAYFPGVEEDFAVVIGQWEFHRVGAYLRTAEIARTVCAR
jgi:hypothetical protein